MFGMTDGDTMTSLVTKSVDINGGLQVVKINSHLTDDDAVSDLKKWHEEKNRITNDLVNVQNSIDQIYNQLMTTDFKSDTTVTQFELQEKLTKYYTERTLLTSQKINIVENINIYRNDVKNYAKSKFRIRGVTDPTEVIAYLKSSYGDKTDVIGIDIRYKYVTATKETSNNVNIGSTVFTDWVKQPSIERQRKLVYKNTSSYYIDYVNYNDVTNPIKWNQIDIPIMQGEDVILQVRYKLNVGQPFIDLYTPWSSEITQEFPSEMKEITELSSIIQNNENDTISAIFNKTLINDGYTKHISDTLIDNAKEYLHSADKINSGFLNSSNNIMSLREKLDLIDSEVLKYKSLIEGEINTQFEVYVTYEGQTMDLLQNVVNEVPAFTKTSSNNSFIKKKLNIVIRNASDTTPMTLMTMFPGTRDTNIRDYNNDIAFCGDDHKHYDNVLLTHGTSNVPRNSIFEQTLGQWIYFRNDDPYTYEKLYSDKLYKNYISNIKATKQLMFNESSLTATYENGNAITIDNVEKDDTIYDDYIVLFEHVVNKNKAHWSESTAINTFTDQINNAVQSVLVPNLSSKTALLCDVDKTDMSQKKQINAKQTLTIPLIFEYYFTNNSTEHEILSNTIAFTFRPSRLATPVTYVLKVSAEK